jgi:hypothetical protein
MLRLAFYVLKVAPPPATVEYNIGVLLFHYRTNRMWFQMARAEDIWSDKRQLRKCAEYVDSVSDMLAAMMNEVGARTLLKHFETTLSNLLRISERSYVDVDAVDPRVTLLDLYHTYVESNRGRVSRGHRHS